MSARVIDTLDLGALIGQGRRSKIFELSDGRVVKLFGKRTGIDYVGAEFEVTRQVRECGVSAWRVDDVVLVDGRPGIVGERISGQTYVAALRSGRLSLRAAVSNLFAAHVALAQLDQLPPSLFRRGRPVDELIGPIDCDPRALERQGVCHGDLSFDNLMIDASGRTVLVDWSSAFYGPVLADVAIANRALRGALSRPGSRLAHRVAKPASVFTHRFLTCRAMGWPLIRFAVGVGIVFLGGLDGTRLS